MSAILRDRSLIRFSASLDFLRKGASSARAAARCCLCSFFESLPEVFETKTDHLIGYARTEYHCKNCGGHHGHIFEDGPQPTGKRFCNNGICLVFKQKD